MRNPESRELTLGIILAAVLAGVPAKAESGDQRRGDANRAVATVHEVDWMNGTFDLGDRSYLFADGHHADLDEDGQCQVCLQIRKVSFGDVDHDGQAEAILLVSSNLGGAGLSLDAYVFGMANGKPVLRAQIEGGDRGDGGIQGVTVTSTGVVVRRFDLSATDDMCCPSRVLVEQWHWSAGNLSKGPGPPVIQRRKPRRWSAHP
jgi:hypothetical protein